MPDLIPFPSPEAKPIVAEFFAGIGLARMGLEAAGFKVAWANDIERDKRDMYVNHFADPEDEHTFVLDDVGQVHGKDLPPGLSLAWASFPCTDLSLAGWRRGLAGTSSSTFWLFANVIDELEEDDRPALVALENVTGLATSHKGRDLAAAVQELNRLGYSADVLTLDARRFLPQSRPRLFIVGCKTPPTKVDDSLNELRPEWLQAVFANPDLRTHRAAIDPPPRFWTSGLSEKVEELPLDDDRWWDDKRRDAFLRSLSPIQTQRLAQFQRGKMPAYRTAYRRTRNGIPMWEIRPDDISGCLRTARGGSSKQAVVRAGNGRVDVRWMTPREYAILMGADEYKLDGVRNNQALFGFGDAVCVPAIKWLADEYLMPLLEGKLDASAANSATATHA